jgi:hypothetical protein
MHLVADGRCELALIETGEQAAADHDSGLQETEAECSRAH